MSGSVRTIGARVQLDGEAEYKKALNELNAGNKTLATEMQKLQAEFKGNTESTEYLTRAGELLERQLLQQQDKVKLLQDRLKAAAQQYGESDARTQQFAAQLNRAQTEEYNLQHAIDENNAALKGQDEQMLALGDTVDQLADKFGVTLPKGARDALNGMEGLSAGTVAAMAAAAAAIAAVIKVVQELGQMTLDVAAQVDEYLAQSAITGVPTEMLQAWDYAAPLIDTDAETIMGAMTKITRAMGEASEGNDAAIAKFAELGVSIQDSVTGGLRSAEEVFYDVVDALGQVENQTQRDAIAMDLMGKSAQDLNPLINAGSKALKEYGAEATATGYILDRQQIRKLGEVDDAYQKLQLTIEANRKQLAADFAPAAKSSMELFTDVVRKAGEMLERSGIITNLASIIESLVAIVRTGGEILSGLPGFDSALGALKVTLGAIAQFVALIADAADVVAGMLTLDFSRIGNAMGFGKSSGTLSHWQSVYMQQSGTLDQYREYYANKSGTSALYSDYGYDTATGQYYDKRTGNYIYGHNAGGTENWRGGLTWVGESGPELVSLPQGSQIMSNQESRSMASPVIYANVTIDAKNVKEFNDVVNIMLEAATELQTR